MEKRGQTEVGLGTFLIVIIGVIGLILVGMFVYNSWSKINKVSEMTPEDRTIYASACEQALSLKEQGYCKDFKEVKIGKEKQYMNCDHLNTQFGLGIDSREVPCDETVANEYCTYLNTTKVVTPVVYKIVNGKNCSVSGLNELNVVA